ncbi:MAG: hypothetical protein HQ567_34225 [Candidatus Nealsonbacteria bacterium]|nr:hypothetical protein [Candidatus Nealsonbacteria bacterium]
MKTDLARQVRGFVRDKVKRFCYKATITFRYHCQPRQPKQVFFVITRARSGSTLFDSYLNSVSDVASAGEVLGVRLPQGLPRRVKSEKQVLRHISYCLNNLPERVSGAKLLLGQMHLRELTIEDLHVRFPNAKYLILYRGSVVKNFLSWTIAKQTGKWVRAQFDKTIHIAPEDFLQFCKRGELAFREILQHDWLRSQASIVRYEDLATDQQRVFEQDVFPLLDLPVTSVHTSMAKQSRRRPCDVVENYDEVRELFEQYGTMKLSWDEPYVDIGNVASDCTSKR